MGPEICEDCNLKTDYIATPGTIISMFEIAGCEDIWKVAVLFNSEHGLEMLI